IREELAVDLIYSEILLRKELGEALQREEYLQRFPQYTALLWRQLQLHEALRDAALPAVSSARAERPTPGPAAGRSGGACPSVPEAGSGGAAGDFPVIPGFDLLGLLGSGGRGVVYRARQRSLGRVVALKMIRHDEDLAGRDGRSLFQREAEAAARL